MRGKVAAVAAPHDASALSKLHARVLLVEDNPVNQELAQHMLEFLGCRTTTASDGRRAVEALVRDSFDAVLMDCEMPEMDGFEATAAIRLREVATGKPRLPIIALTAGAVEDDRDKCLAAGMDDYLSKPFSIEQLEALLRRWLPQALAEPHVDARVLETLLIQTGGGPALLKTLIGSYLRDAPQRLGAIRLGMGRGDAAAVARASHAFKSSNANLGALALALLCKRLEAHCRTGVTVGAETLVDAIEREFVHVRGDLEARAREITA
jgi:CheY-like chemotaxis protein